MKQPKYIKDHDKKYGTKHGMPKVKVKKQKYKKGYVYNTGKGLEMHSGSKPLDNYWNSRVPKNTTNYRTKG